VEGMVTAPPPAAAPALAPAPDAARAADDVVRGDLDGIRAALAAELPELAGTHLLVTGGAGFLGHYLVQAALDWNRTAAAGLAVRVTVHDTFARGLPAWLERLRGAPRLTLERRDASQPLPTDAARFDWIVHAASIASPTYYRQHPLETMDANVAGVRHLLEYCRARGDSGNPVRGMLFFSTSEIYGDPPADQIPTPETFRGNVSCTGPRACYDESKRYGETLCTVFARRYGVPVSIARPFNNYGPGLKITDGRVLSDFAGDVLAGRDVVLLSSGAPTRTFCYVSDAVAGYYKVLVRGRAGEAYNVGAEAPEVSMADLADRVVRQATALFGYRGRVVRRASSDAEYLTDNPQRRVPVIEKARTELGYAPQVGLDEGLRRALLWYAGNPAGEDG
jgi:UDP-glucuronate decarboxylase